MDASCNREVQGLFYAQLLCYWTYPLSCFLFKTSNVSETGFYLRLQVEPTQYGSVDRASPYLWTSDPIE
jgi:hypothetical protein